MLRTTRLLSVALLSAALATLPSFNGPGATPPPALAGTLIQAVDAAGPGSAWLGQSAAPAEQTVAAAKKKGTKGFVPPPLPSPVVLASNFGSIQEAIDSLPGSGGSVHVAKGLYHLDAALKLRNGVTLFGDGIGNTVLQVQTRLSNGIVNATLEDGDGPGAHDMGIRDLTVEASDASERDCCFAIKLSGADRVLIVNVGANGAGKDGIYAGVRKIHGNLSGGQKDSDKPSTHIRISGCEARDNGRNGVALTNVSSSIVEGCTVAGNGFGGIVLEPDPTRLTELGQAARLTFDNFVAKNTVQDSGVGILLFSRNRDVDQVANNAICGNSVEENARAGIFDGSEVGSGLHSGPNVFLDNTVRHNGPPNTSLLQGEVTKRNKAKTACTLPSLFPA
jgi:parallel beta-helix repeat protein